MKTTTLPVLAGLFTLLVFCGEKLPAETPAAANGGAVVLAKRHYLPPAGTVTSKEAKMLMPNGEMTLTAGDQEMKGSMNRTTASKETMEILSPDKTRRLLVSEENTGEMKLNGKVQPTPDKPDALVGVAAILDRKGDTWTAGLESGAAPTPDQKKCLKKLETSANRDEDFEMYGDTPRKPGDKWNVDPSKLMSFMDAGNLTGTYTVEFVEVKEFQGVKCAVLKATFDFKGASLSDGDSKAMEMAIKGEAVSRRSLADMIDLDVELNGTMTIDGAPAPNVTMHVEGPVKFSQRYSLKKP